MTEEKEHQQNIYLLRVTEINWSRQYPSSLPHFTSLLMTQGQKSLIHKLLITVCVCARKPASLVEQR